MQGVKRQKFEGSNSNLTEKLLSALDTLKKDCIMTNYIKCIELGMQFSVVDKEYWKRTVQMNGDHYLLFGYFLTDMNNNIHYLQESASPTCPVAAFTYGAYLLKNKAAHGLVHPKKGVVARIEWYKFVLCAASKGCVFACEFMLKRYKKKDFFYIYTKFKYFDISETDYDIECTTLYINFVNTPSEVAKACRWWTIIKDSTITNLLPDQIYTELQTWLKVAKRMRLTPYLTNRICDEIALGEEKRIKNSVG